jgi:glycosyltransferase involved in cell wall biosynthesis
MSNPFFSIIIPTYNRAHFLPKAIESVILQSFTDWELIIVDDGSTDNTRNIVEPYLTDARIVYQYQHNQERCVARNNGINTSKGQFITFLDSDDYFLPNRLSLLHNFLSEDNLANSFYYTGLAIEKEGITTERSEILVDTFQNVYDFICTSVIFSQQVCIRRNILLKHHYDSRFVIGEDMELWLRIATEHLPKFIPDQATIIVCEHDERSINEKKSNPGAKQLLLLKHIFKKPHPGSLVTKMVKKRKLSDTYFGIARHYIYNGKRFLAIIHLLRSIYFQPRHEQTKHRVYLIAKLSMNLKTEYK